MKKRVFIGILVLLLVLCAAGVFAMPKAKALSNTSSRLYVAKNENAGLYGDVILISKSSEYILYLPGSADAGKLCFTWGSDTTVKDSAGKTLSSGKAPVAAPGKSVTYNVNGGNRTIRTVQGSKDVKAMFLSVDTSIAGFYSFSTMNDSSDKSKSAAGTMTYGETGGYYFSIKGRGNSTWTAGYAKKPYNITLYKDDGYVNKKGFELIDGVKAKKWSLLANYSDISMLRNKLGYDMANRMGIGLESAFVDLYADGEYLGTYLMTPKNDYESPKNGYMLEIDNYTSNEDYQFTLDGMGEYHSSWYGYQNRISVKDNESMTPNAEIEAYMQKAWKAMLDTESEDYLNYIDLDSWAKFYILHEFYKSFDVVCGSILMHRDGTAPTDKLIAGPMWDLDNAMGRTNNNADLGLSKSQQHSPDGWYIPAVSDPEGRVKTFWLQQLGKHDSFMDRVYEIYHQYSYVFDGAAGRLDTFSSQLKSSAAMNFDLYGFGASSHKVTSADGHGCVATNSWSDYVKNLRNYAVKRAAFLKGNVPAVLTGTVSITGEAKNGGVLTATVSGTNATDLVYTWKCGTRSATGKTFTLREADLGKAITCTVTSGSMQGSLTKTLTAVRVTLAYNGATGGNSQKAISCYTGLTYSQLPTPTKTGCTFEGWFTGQNGTGSRVTADTEVTKTVSHNLYACWKKVAADPEPTDPVAPTVPVTPTDPVTPTVPVAPTVPTEPVTPTEPVAPTSPDETTAPTEPVGTEAPPTEPATEPSVPGTEPEAPTGGTTESGTVPTGPEDSTTAPTLSQLPATRPGEPTPPAAAAPGLNIWYIVAPGAAILLVLLLLLLLRKKKKDD